MADNAIVTSSSIPFEYVSKENFAISSLLNDTSGNIDNIGLGDTARSNDILYNHTLDINSDSISIVDNMSKHVISYSMKCPVTSIVHDTRS